MFLIAAVVGPDSPHSLLDGWRQISRAPNSTGPPAACRLHSIPRQPSEPLSVAIGSASAPACRMYTHALWPASEIRRASRSSALSWVPPGAS